MSFFRNKMLGLFVKTNGLISKYLFGGIGFSVMLHRVLPAAERNKFGINQSLAITPEALENWIIYFKEKGYEMISVADLEARIHGRLKFKEKSVVFTLDDGYLDNLKYALPVFEKHQVPVCLFVTSCFPEKRAIFWWYLLEKYIEVEKELRFTWRNEQYDFKWESVQEGENAFHQIREVLRKFTNEEMNSLINGELVTVKHYNEKYRAEIALNWDQLKTLSEHPLVTIGGHTENHVSLGYLSEKEQEQEVESNRNKIKDYLGKEPLFFAYPYGTLDDVGLSRKGLEKFKLAFLNHPGNIFKVNENIGLTLVPRIGLSDDTTKERILQMENGIFHFATNGFKKHFVLKR